MNLEFYTFLNNLNPMILNKVGTLASILALVIATITYIKVRPIKKILRNHKIWKKNRVELELKFIGHILYDIKKEIKKIKINSSQSNFYNKFGNLTEYTTKAIERISNLTALYSGTPYHGSLDDRLNTSEDCRVMGRVSDAIDCYKRTLGALPSDDQEKCLKCYIGLQWCYIIKCNKEKCIEYAEKIEAMGGNSLIEKNALGNSVNLFLYSRFYRIKPFLSSRSWSRNSKKIDSL